MTQLRSKPWQYVWKWGSLGAHDVVLWKRVNNFLWSGDANREKKLRVVAQTYKSTSLCPTKFIWSFLSASKNTKGKMICFSFPFSFSSLFFSFPVLESMQTVSAHLHRSNYSNQFVLNHGKFCLACTCNVNLHCIHI